MIKLILQRGILGVTILLSVTASLAAIAPTREEKEFLRVARQRNHQGARELIADMKHAWGVVSYFHKGVGLNNKLHDALAECWQQAYRYNDSSYYLKITEQDLTRIFELMIMELQPRISYYEKQRATSQLRPDAHAFARESQQEFRATVERAQRLIMRHLSAHIPATLREQMANATTRVFKDGIRFTLYVALQKHANGFTRHDVNYINAKVRMFIREVERDYPYISVAQYESWVFALLQDLLFAECAVCMDHKADRYMPCCKSKAICRKCYSRVSSCPLCRAPKRGQS